MGKSISDTLAEYTGRHRVAGQSVRILPRAEFDRLEEENPEWGSWTYGANCGSPREGVRTVLHDGLWCLEDRTGLFNSLVAVRNWRIWRLYWGFASTGSPAGVVGDFDTEAEASEAAAKWQAEHYDAIAAACWIEEISERVEACPE